jgi:hypothetical protein
LAAWGIARVRADWTDLLGIRRQSVRWLTRFGRGLSRPFRWLFRKLRHRPQVVHPFASDAAGGADAVVSLSVSYAPPPANASPEERIEWLEQRVMPLLSDVAGLKQDVADERRSRAASESNTSARIAALESTMNKKLSTFAGSGLRLQAWGVACLLVGSLCTAFPEWVAWPWRH